MCDVGVVGFVVGLEFVVDGGQFVVVFVGGCDLLFLCMLCDGLIIY